MYSLKRFPWRSAILLGLLCIALSARAAAQVTAGEISGTVTDPSDAPIAAATVTVINEQTGFQRGSQTNLLGIYLVTGLAPGRYAVKINSAGFKEYAVSGITLIAGAKVGLNPKLEIGAVTESVSVVASPQQVETESGAVGRLIDGTQAVDLVLNGRNLFQLLVTVPGFSFQSKYYGNNFPGSFGLVHANGLRFQQLNFTLDGSVNQDIMHFGFINNEMSPDFVQEVKVNSSGHGAELGRGGGVQVNYVTKSGTEEFHGNLFEFYRTSRYNARNFFLSQPGFVLAHNFGWTLGGPVLIPKLFEKGDKKLFFFVGQDYRRRTNPKMSRATAPTHAERAGIITTSKTLRYPSNFPVASLRGEPIMDPSRATPGNSLGLNILPQQYMTENGKAMMRVFDVVEPLATQYVDQMMPSNMVFNTPMKDTRREDVVRVDYQMSQKHQFYARYVHDDGMNDDPVAQGDLPTVAGGWKTNTSSTLFSYTFVPTPRVVNEIGVTSTYAKRGQVFYGDYAFPSKYGLNVKELFGNDMQVYGLPFIGIEGYTMIPGARANPTEGAQWDFSIRDHFSYLVGKHNLRAGGLVVRFRRNARIQSDTTGFINFSSSGNVYTTGNSLTDMLIGNYQEYRETNVDKFNFLRLTQLEGYVTDTWKVTRNLTLDLGLRYYHIGPAHVRDNTISTFVPGLYDPAKAQQVIATGPDAGTLAPGVGQAYNGIVVAGSDFPDSRTAPKDPLAQSLFRGFPTGLYSSQNKVGPRVGFAYDPTGRGLVSLRGAIGIGYERFSDSQLQDLGKNPPFVNTVSLFDGNIENLASGRPGASFPISMTGYRPNMQAQGVYNWNFGFQLKAPFQSLLDVNYVSTQGRHLMRRVDVNKLSPAERLASVNVNQNSVRRYQGYTSIQLWETSASSNYQALQVSATRRYARNLTYSLGYTWGKAMTDAWDINAEPEDINNYRNEKGIANYNRDHVFNFSFIYEFPFFTAQTGIVGKLLGGWRLSGITSLETGRYATVWASTLAGYRRPDRVGDFIYLDPREEQTITGGDGQPVRGHFWFDPTPGKTIVMPPDDRYGNAAPYLMRGPGLINTDAALMKNTRLHERVTLQLRLEAFNAFNHANFVGVGATLGQRDLGTITSADFAREIQLGAKLIF